MQAKTLLRNHAAAVPLAFTFAAAESLWNLRALSVLGTNCAIFSVILKRVTVSNLGKQKMNEPSFPSIGKNIFLLKV